jgi:hypothetical protein
MRSSRLWSSSAISISDRLLNASDHEAVRSLGLGVHQLAAQRAQDILDTALQVAFAFQHERADGYLRGAVAWTDTLPTRRYWWLASEIGTIATANSMDRDTSASFTMADEQWVLVQTNRGAVLEQRGLPVTAARIRPSPCAGGAMLDLAPGMTGPVVVRVCDAAGRVVLRQTATGNTTRLDLRGNRAGLYICTVTAAGRVVTEPLVLLK